MSHSSESCEQPRVLIPFSQPPGEQGEYQDFFIILRPESNGTRVESLLMQVITGNPVYKSGIKFLYLANIPGEYIVHHRVVEQHYHLKISFARKGAALFTPYMENCFIKKFKKKPRDCRILGAFDALNYLGCTEEELFKSRVDFRHMLEVNGQNIKKIRGTYVVNYDIPALLHKNNSKTDVAVMIFRSRLEKAVFQEMVSDMGKTLVREGILREHFPLSRVFHYSRGPFEFFLDASGYLLKDSESTYPLGNLDFVRFMNQHDVPLRVLEGLVKYPLLEFELPGGGLVEGDIFQYTFGNTFEEACRKLMSARRQYCIS